MSQETSLEEGIAGAEVLRQKHVVQNTFMNSILVGGGGCVMMKYNPSRAVGRQEVHISPWTDKEGRRWRCPSSFLFALAHCPLALGQKEQYLCRETDM